MFLKDYWYVAGWSDEVTRTPIARTYLNEDVVLYRKESGEVVALEDRCAHRRLPLSEGRIKGDTLQCRYHGLIYDGSGACVHIPGQKKIPAGVGVRAYPTFESNNFVYIWMGDPSEADPATATTFDKLDAPGWSITKVHLNIKANYLLVIDNLLDLSHVAYVHNTTIGNDPVAEDAEVKTEIRDTGIRVSREMNDVEAARTYREFGKFEENFDRWQLSEFILPGYFWINNGSEACDNRQNGPERLETMGEWGFQVFHGITPETDRTTHQFWAVAHEDHMVAEADREEFYRQCHQVIMEDVEVYEAQQMALDSDPRGATAQDVQSSIMISYDEGLLKARRMISKQLEAGA